MNCGSVHQSDIARATEHQHPNRSDELSSSGHRAVLPALMPVPNIKGAFDARVANVQGKLNLAHPEAQRLLACLMDPWRVGS